MPVVRDRLEAYLPLLFQEREEFGTSARVLFESTEQTGSFHDRVLLLDPAHHHAEMFRFHDDGDAVWFQTVHQRLGDLRRQVFLNLQTARKNIDNARDFRQSDDFAIGNVSDVGAADEWEQMMLAHRIEFDVFDENDFARFRIEDGVVDDLLDALAIALREKFHRARRPSWRFRQALAIPVFTDRVEQFAIDFR